MPRLTTIHIGTIQLPPFDRIFCDVNDLHTWIFYNGNKEVHRLELEDVMRVGDQVLGVTFRNNHVMIPACTPFVHYEGPLDATYLDSAGKSLLDRMADSVVYTGAFARIL